MYVNKDCRRAHDPAVQFSPAPGAATANRARERPRLKDGDGGLR